MPLRVITSNSNNNPYFFNENFEKSEKINVTLIKAAVFAGELPDLLDIPHERKTSAIGTV